VDLKQQVNVFSLGDRAQILQQIDSPSIVRLHSILCMRMPVRSRCNVGSTGLSCSPHAQVPHVALQTSQKIIFEELYRSYHHLLLDTITHECGKPFFLF
jgi:hypothetical protein